MGAFPGLQKLWAQGYAYRGRRHLLAASMLLLLAPMPAIYRRSQSTWCIRSSDAKPGRHRGLKRGLYCFARFKCS
jgi:hypothetical protein